MAVGQGEFTHQKRPRSRGTVALLVLVAVGLTPGSIAQLHLMVIRAGEGETVTIECPNAQKTGHVSWCKVNSRGKCQVIVNTEKEEDRSGRISMRRLNGSVFVTSQLQKNDAGTYWCGTLQAKKINVSDIVMLDVFTADSRILNRTTVKGIMGNATTIHCRYKVQFEEYEKFLCKVVSVNSCSIIATPQHYNSSKLSISGNKFNNFAVTIRHADEGDVGEYWCGARTPVDFEISQVKTVMFKGTITKAEVPSNKARDIVLNVRRVWGVLRWVLFGVLLLFPLSICCVTTFKRKITAETLEMGSAVVEEGEEQRR